MLKVFFSSPGVSMLLRLRTESCLCSHGKAWRYSLLQKACMTSGYLDKHLQTGLKYHLKSDFWTWYTKKDCWDEINLGAYSSWHVWSTRRLRSSSNPWSLVILQVTWWVKNKSPEYLCSRRLLSGRATSVEICRDRRDQRSCKICASCVNFPGKQRNFSHKSRRTKRFIHT